MKSLLLILLLLPVTVSAQGHTCALLYSADDPVDLVYDSTLHTFAVQRIYPGAVKYGWIGHLPVDLGVPDGPPYDEGGVWRQDYGPYAMIWQPGSVVGETVYDPPDLDEIWPLLTDGWGDPVTSLSFHQSMGIIIAKQPPDDNLCDYDVNGDGIANPVDVVLLANWVYKNQECVK